MARLEELTDGASIRGVLPSGLVTVVAVQWIGGVLIKLTYRDSAGVLGNQLIYRADEPTLEIVTGVSTRADSRARGP